MSLKPTAPKGTRDFSSKVLSKRNYLKMVLQNHLKVITFRQHFR